jgi:hypothetical protein
MVIGPLGPSIIDPRGSWIWFRARFRGGGVIYRSTIVGRRRGIDIS